MPKPKARYVPGQRYWEKEYIEVGVEDDFPIWIKARTSLTAAEFEQLSFVPEKDEDGNDIDIPMDTVRETMAPFIVDWNLGRDVDGTVEDVPPPAAGDWTVLQLIPVPLLLRILNDMRRMVVKPVDPKSSTSPATTASP